MATTASAQVAAAEAPVKQHSALLRKELGLRDLIFAQIVIVMIPDFFGTAAKSGASHVLFWLLGIALFFIPLTLVVVHLNRLMPLEGGLYEWARLGVNDQIGFLTAWNVWLFNAFYTGCIGLLTVTFVSYALGPQMVWIADNKGIVIVASIALIATLSLLAHLGLGVGKWVTNLGSTMTMFAIVALICMPLIHILRGTCTDYHPLRLVMPPLNLSSLSVFSKMIFGALTSFEFVAIFAGECLKDAVLGCQVFIAQEQFLIDSSSDVCQQTWPFHFGLGLLVPLERRGVCILCGRGLWKPVGDPTEHGQELTPFLRVRVL